MDVSMRNIAWSATKPKIVESLAHILHNPPFSDLWPGPNRMNFHVHLHRDKNRGIRQHNGRGTLTLPTIQIGQRFLELYGSLSHPSNIPFFVEARRIDFSESKGRIRSDVLEEVRMLPYVEPYAAEERERRQQELHSGIVHVKVLQFGWQCRDIKFSVECEEICENRCDVVFNDDRREIRILLSIEDELYGVAMKISSVQAVYVDTYLQSEHALVFDLYTPPSYEKHRGEDQPRQRLSFLPINEHERVAPYASLAIRLVCQSRQDLDAFRHLCMKAQLHRVYEDEYPVVHRDLFSFSAMERVQTILRQLHWPVAFQMQSLLRDMAIDFREAIQLLPHVIATMQEKGGEFTATLVRKFRTEAKKLFLDEDFPDLDVVTLFHRTRHEVEKLGTLTTSRPSDGSLYDSFHVEVTPTTFHLDGPVPEQSNRVIRRYDKEHQESFLRVSFVDEAKLPYRFDREIDGREFIEARVGTILSEGLKVAGKRFEFLAYSQSALKEHAVWFVKPFNDSTHGYVDAPSIIASLGTFHNLQFDPNLIYCPARYGARLAQAFTATDAVKVEVEEIFYKDDITTEDGKYMFTDGVGTLSGDLNRAIWTQLKKAKRRRLQRQPPGSYQIRYMGSKGMLSVDHTLSGSAVCLRPSMIKFETSSAAQDIEIARAFDRPMPYNLNRPLIMLLEGLEVPFDVFKHYQDMAVEATRRAARSLGEAAKLLDIHGLGASYRLSSVLLSLEKLRVDSLPDDTFYEKMLELAVNHVLRVLKNQARIPIPGAWTLVGVADVHRYLEPDEIFACIKPVHGGTRYLQGPVLISRSPVIHPGDVRIVNAIGLPPVGSCFASEPLTNTVVFSVKGARPVPSCLGGGDLDGDIYNLIPLEDLPEFVPGKMHDPASYDPAPKKMLDRPSTMEDVAEFFMEYISSDVVGIVATNWLLIADQSPLGIFDPDCMKLAILHSNAVDYPKSGHPVELKDIPKPKGNVKPDWHAPETVDISSGKFTESQRAIGRLFRAIDLPVEQQPNVRRRGRRQTQVREIDELEDVFSQFSLDDARERYLFAAVEQRVQEFIWITSDEDQNDDEIAFIAQLFRRYASELRATCMANTLSHARNSQLSEAEAVIGTIVQKTSQRRKRTEAMSKLRESTATLVRGIREELAGDDTITSHQTLQRAWVAWEFAVSQDKTFGAQSFGWIALGAIFEAIKEIEGEDFEY